MPYSATELAPEPGETVDKSFRALYTVVMARGRQSLPAAGDRYGPAEPIEAPAVDGDIAAGVPGEMSITRPEGDSPMTGRSSSIDVSGVGKVFGQGDSAVTALEDVSFEVPAGGFVSLLGPSGCGKSTLLRLISGLDHPTSGTITVGGKTPEKRRKDRDFGIVFQSPVLFEWRTVEKNVALPMEVMGYSRSELNARTRELLELVGLTDFRRHRPSQLSGGMQQRVAIARALSFGPPYLMMDEPFGALDMMTRERMQTELLAIWARTSGTTVTFITHSISEAILLSDQIVVMSARPGRVERLFNVDIPRPRTDAVRSSAEFGEIEAEIRHLVYAQGQK